MRRTATLWHVQVQAQVDREAMLLWYEAYMLSHRISGAVATTAMLLTRPGVQVKSGGLPARVATEGVMLQYAGDAHLDELLAHLWVQVRGKKGRLGRGRGLEGLCNNTRLWLKVRGLGKVKMGEGGL